MRRISLLALAAMALRAQAIEEIELRQRITRFKRVFVDRLTGGDSAGRCRRSGVYRAALRFGGANTRLNAAMPRSGYGSRSGSAGLGSGDNESEHSTERRREAIARCGW